MYRRSAIQLITALLLAGTVQAMELKQASLLDSYVWRDNADWFGGFSAIHISENGQNMVAISDRSTLITARIERDQDKIIDIQVLDRWPILSSRGAALSGRAGDSEGLAIAEDGSFYVSFEGIHRVVHYTAPDAKARILPRPEAFLRLDQNGSLEALAINDRGWLYTLVEKKRTAQGAIPVFRWDGSRWSAPFVLPASDKFLPVAADIGPDARLYVLERAVSLTGFRSRLRRWVIDDDVPQTEEILFETGTGTHDNLEGLSVWRDLKGQLRATMVSDDNFFALQRTELVEYLLPD